MVWSEVVIYGTQESKVYITASLRLSTEGASYIRRIWEAVFGVARALHGCLYGEQMILVKGLEGLATTMPRRLMRLVEQAALMAGTSRNTTNVPYYHWDLDRYI